MIKDWLSRYHPRYPRALAYMLQATEYDVRDYLAWYSQTADFIRVERRKEFVGSLKGKLILVSAWLILLCLYALAIGSLWLISEPISYVAFVVLILLAPFLLAYLILIPLGVIKAIQYPVEQKILKRAKGKISRHRGIKIAIAGSFGKTSMREILGTVLSQGKKVATPPHSHNTPLGISEFIDTLTGNEDIVIFELGEYYPGDIRKLCELVHPNIGIITGINEAHLKKFKTLDRTADTIFELSAYVDPKKLYVNGESQLARTRADKNIIYDRTGVGNWRVKESSSDLNGTSFSLTKGSDTLKVHSSLLGMHQVGPLSLAAEIATQVGLSPSEIQVSLSKTTPFEHRLNPIKDSSDVIMLDDSYNGNPDGVNAVINFLASLKNHRRFYVTPGLVEMGSETESVHKAIGRKLAEAEIEKVVLVKNSVTPFIEKGLKESHYHGEVLWFDDALDAFRALPNLTVAGDVVLLQNDWPDQYR
jgi:UDP-N-acetylmuramoyl-tripeptide--D-alanyl-D-alanine ligase